MLRHFSSTAPPTEILRSLHEDGAAIIDGLLSPEQLAQAHAEVASVVAKARFGVGFGGIRTQRAGGMIVAAPSSRALVMHELVLDVASAFLAPWTKKMLLSLTQAINIHPGQEAQMLHRDRLGWGAQLPRAIEPQLYTIWALTEFVAHNGATRVIPGSHLWDDARKERDEEIAIAEMSAGSVLLYSGTVLHSGGANSSTTCRLGLNIGYCLSWLRQEENQYLSCPPSVARELHPRLQALLGYTTSDFGLGSYSSAEGAISCPEVILSRAAEPDSMALQAYIASARS